MNFLSRMGFKIGEPSSIQPVKAVGGAMPCVGLSGIFRRPHSKGAFDLLFLYNLITLKVDAVHLVATLMLYIWFPFLTSHSQEMARVYTFECS